MPEARSIPFEYTAGPASVLRVTALDGTPYEIRLAVAVFEVLDTGNTNADGSALFEVRANVTLDTKRREE